jgi:hypothetical protein
MSKPKTLTDEQKRINAERISVAMKGKVRTPEHQAKLNMAILERWQTKEFRDKTMDAMKKAHEQKRIKKQLQQN